LNNELVLELKYQPDNHIAYQNLCDLPGFALLESSDRLRGRYDILTACPYERVVINPCDEHTPELLAYLRSLLVEQKSAYDLPFQGGALGYISYDLGAQLAGVHALPQSSLHGMPLLNLGFYDWAIITDHLLKKTTLFAANQHASTADVVNEVLGLWNQSESVARTFKLAQGFSSVMSKPHYEYGFNEIKKALKQGRSYQVNFTQPFHAPYEGDPWAIYRTIRVRNPVPFSAFLNLDNASILSFSPERFLLHDQGRLSTSPIKGTIGRSDHYQEDERLKAQLLASEKNRVENIMIVDLLRNDLGKIATTGSVKVLNLCELQSYANVHHLVSTIDAKSQTSMNPLDLFLACFPGGSITGTPKLESMRIINELELYGRGVYCGGIVYFSRHGRFDSNIAIRTITAKNQILHLAAGGGIVIDSECEDEYRECFIKIQAIMNALK
jgi:para-aminobenzoate synthetase component 1